MKTTPGGAIILKMSTINENYMYDSWDMVHNRQNFLQFRTIFCPFTPPPPLTTNRIKILRQWKNTWRYHHFTQVHHKWQSYDIWFLRYEVHQIEFFLSSWAIFCPFTHLTAWKVNFSKKWKKPRRYHHFTQAYQKSSSYARKWKQLLEVLSF